MIKTFLTLEGYRECQKQAMSTYTALGVTANNLGFVGRMASDCGPDGTDRVSCACTLSCSSMGKGVLTYLWGIVGTTAGA